MAASGTISASYGVEAGTCTRANMPGVNRPWALSSCARPRIVPVARSMTLSTKSMRAEWEKSGSSSSFKRTVVLPRPVTSAAGDRRAELGEFEIERGLAHHRLACRHRGLGVTECLRALLEDLLADGPIAQQLLSACQVRLGENDVRFRGLEIGAGLVEGVLERPLVDGEQQVTLVHDLAVGEVDLVEVARYARAHLDDVHGDEAADIFVLVHDGALRGPSDRHLRWRQRRLLLAFAAA